MARLVVPGALLAMFFGVWAYGAAASRVGTPFLFWICIALGLTLALSLLVWDDSPSYQQPRR
jgi:hypothetical protein